MTALVARVLREQRRGVVACEPGRELQHRSNRVGGGFGGKLQMQRGVIHASVRRRRYRLMLHREQSANQIDDAACGEHVPDVRLERSGKRGAISQSGTQTRRLVPVGQLGRGAVWNHEIDIRGRSLAPR